MNENTTPSVDLDPHNRPGVPMEKEPEPLPGVHWTRPERQSTRPGLTHRAELKQMTPVFGTGQPLKGLSGMVRRTAYGIPETLVRHWLLLLMADRIDVLESRFGKLAKGGAVGGAAFFAAWAGLRALRTVRF